MSDREREYRPFVRVAGMFSRLEPVERTAMDAVSALLNGSTGSSVLGLAPSPMHEVRADVVAYAKTAEGWSHLASGGEIAYVVRVHVGDVAGGWVIVEADATTRFPGHQPPYVARSIIPVHVADGPEGLLLTRKAQAFAATREIISARAGAARTRYSYCEKCRWCSDRRVVVGGCVVGRCVVGRCVVGGCVVGGCVVGGCVVGGCVSADACRRMRVGGCG